MDNMRRKELIRAAKEATPRQGIFAVRCGVTGTVWVAKCTDLDKRKAGLWFQLGMGGFPGKSLQAAFSAHGEAAFAFVELEEVRDENELLLPQLLKEREGHWRKELDAEALV
ncbi:hypothetical protein FHS83_000306 [Rhizomicrobium palustre]|uniref:GIY-YIG nuclease family protein n=1 Tax=Rhizomicrobium palustre TaxID=189966 RepID=A0A846MU06_9PROT|nr:GIY-YIG nuclease family protein [Rhizomicrobium palustre]NIK86988.1 hypothetical protein [Rhizomicrobium palustre]